jgi:hypothetical protein
MLDIDERKVARNEFGLWLGWTLATMVGMLLGLLTFVPLLPIFDLALARVVIPLWAGFLVGTFQWLVLRRYLTHSVDWILNGGVGWAVGFGLGLIIIQSLSDFPWGALAGYIIFGFIIGVLQWPVLRREIPDVVPWILASVLGWALGAYLSQVVLDIFIGGGAVNPAVSTIIIAGTTGLVAGAITGLVLVWIVRHPERENLPPINSGTTQ